jgi:hypothetical protein
MKSSKIRTKVSAQKTVYTFAHLRSVSRECLEHAKAEEAGSTLMICGSMIFSAFTVEAFLNHIGASVTTFWSSVERRLSPPEKLEVLGKLFGLRFDYSTRPFQTFRQMFRFRDALAHGKTESITEDRIQLLRAGERPKLPATAWEKEMTMKNAQVFFEDTRAIWLILAKEAGVDEYQLAIPYEHGYIAHKLL